ncbi:MAG TPA: glycosyltransferase [Vicinamibacterales bacterium]|jgi:GT2 family glycosyltransferase|nr:glycosyltransferase [Vicinamibacterales bacterium]
MTASSGSTDPAPFVSVVVETITAREHADEDRLVDDLAPGLAAIDRQHYPRDRFEVIVALDEDSRRHQAELERRCPFVTVTFSPKRNYFAAKNAGARQARGELVALVDGDCVPDADWLETLTGAMAPGVDVVAGRTRYAGRSASARTFSVPDFGNVMHAEGGSASGFNVNNVLFRREVLLANPLDARVRRNGGCYFLYHRLRKLGIRIVYEPRAAVTHGLDVGGLGFVRKHFDRGFDGTNVYRLDADNVLRGTPVFRRFGAAGLVAIVAHRVLVDWRRLVRERRQFGIPVWSLPYYAGVMTLVRLIELCGGLTAIVSPHLIPETPARRRDSRAA